MLSFCLKLKRKKERGQFDVFFRFGFRNSRFELKESTVLTGSGNSRTDPNIWWQRQANRAPVFSTRYPRRTWLRGSWAGAQGWTGGEASPPKLWRYSWWAPSSNFLLPSFILRTSGDLESLLLNQRGWTQSPAKKKKGRKRNKVIGGKGRVVVSDSKKQIEEQSQLQCQHCSLERRERLQIKTLFLSLSLSFSLFFWNPKQNSERHFHMEILKIVEIVRRIERDSAWMKAVEWLIDPLYICILSIKLSYRIYYDI